MADYIPILLPIYVPIILGLIARFTGYFPVEYGHSIRQFCLKITIPLMIFTSMASMDTSTLSQVLPLMLSLPVYMGILWLIALLVSKLPMLKSRRIEAILVIILGNIGYFGWAVTKIGLGEAGLTRSIMFAVLFWPVTILYSFLSKAVVDRTEGGIKSALHTLKIAIPILAAFILGLVIAIIGWRVPESIFEPLSAFGRMTVPLILFGVGLSVSFKAHWGELSLLLPLRLALGFGAAWLTTRMIGNLDDISRTAILMVSVMPVGANSLIMGDILGLDEEFIAGAVTLSALLALVTIPLTLILLV
jgi:predicted permease